MQFLDVSVAEQALQWLNNEEPIWLCTVLATFGSSPRPPGAIFVANKNGESVGSLSGGCVEEDFLARLRDGEFSEPVGIVRYGGAQKDEHKSSSKITLPCGGGLDVLVEKLQPYSENRSHITQLVKALTGQELLLRTIDLQNHTRCFERDMEVTGPRVSIDQHRVHIRVGPAAKLIIAGMSPVSEACAGFALNLGYEVIICDPNEDAFLHFQLAGVKTKAILPSLFIASPGVCHSATAIVALTHDPRIDDLAMMDAVNTPAFYIGVMGSLRTSDARAKRLRQSGGLNEEQIARIKMPVGLALGSKTPAEIALAVMADIVRTLRGVSRSQL